MEHLALEIFDLTGGGSKYATLEEDASITITDTSEVFASGDVWSHSFTLSIPANEHIFGSAGDMHGSRLHEQVDKRRARLWVEGSPMLLGYLRLADEVEVDGDGNVDVTFQSGQKTFDDLIEGAKANQVPLMGDVLIGLALWRKRWTKFELKLAAELVFDGPGRRSEAGDVTVTFEADGEDESIQEYPRMVFPKGEFVNADTGAVESFDCINTDNPYGDEYPYCNVPLCYQRQGYDKKYEDGSIRPDYNSEPEAQRGYEVMPASRVNSAPNFYVLYWIKALMKHIGIHVEENQMMDVEDLRRLFFVNTNCAYRVPDRIRNVPYTEGYGRYRFGDNGRLVAEQFVSPGEAAEGFIPTYSKILNVEDSGFTANITGVRCSRPVSDFPSIGYLSVKIAQLPYLSNQDKAEYKAKNSYLHRAYATSECFPDVEISEVIKALEDGFGVRFLFSGDYKRVRIVLLRNLFRSRDIQDIACDITDAGKTENSIRGFRMTYGDKDDTVFRYKGFSDMLSHTPTLWADNSDTHDYSKWGLFEDYAALLHKVSAFNKTCYVTPVNGNAYGIKVDKEAKRYEELHPSLFEYAGYMDAEDGDCTGGEETVETITVGFTPAIMNDYNWENERTNGAKEQKFALFVDETMRPRRPNLEDLGEGKTYDDPAEVYHVERDEDTPKDRKCLYDMDEDDNWLFGNMMGDNGIVKPGEFSIASDMFAAKKNLKVNVVTGGVFGHGLPSAEWEVSFDLDGHVNEGYRLYLQDNYEPNDDGVAPVETHDWGLTLGIMRGSGSDMRVRYDADPDDQEGNDTWEIEPGSNVTSHPDTCDNYGNFWDYNGEQEGYGNLEDRVSLKLRAEKPNPYYEEGSEDPEKADRYLQIATRELRGRGLMDTFYKEYSYWVRNARVANLTVRMELAQLLSIDKTKRVKVGDVTGFIRKMQYTVSNRTGLSMVTMEIMYI